MTLSTEECLLDIAHLHEKIIYTKNFYLIALLLFQEYLHFVLIKFIHTNADKSTIKIGIHSPNRVALSGVESPHCASFNLSTVYVLFFLQEHISCISHLSMGLLVVTAFFEEKKLAAAYSYFSGIFFMELLYIYSLVYLISIFLCTDMESGIVALLFFKCVIGPHIAVEGLTGAYEEVWTFGQYSSLILSTPFSKNKLVDNKYSRMELIYTINNTLCFVSCFFKFSP
ncbi:hypothetical protein ACJX0J_029663 [Zea mays]